MSDDRLAAVVAMVEELRRGGSWTGRTHIQKNLYLVRALRGVDLGYAHTLYKHGPYSFSLDADIEELRLVRALDYDISQSGHYGPRYKLGPASSGVKGDVAPEVRDAMREMAETFGKLDVRGLECVSTLVWCASIRPQIAQEAAQLHDCVKGLKPHLSDEEIEKAWDMLEPYRNRLATGAAEPATAEGYRF